MASFIGFVLCVELMPVWVAAGYLIVITIPVGIFAFAAFRDRRQRADDVSALQVQNRKTRKLLERSRNR
jgi:hypothetical protein